MQLKMITALILGVVTIVVNFQIYPILVDATDDLSLYFSNSCQTVNGSERFVRAYVGVPSTSLDSVANPNNVYDTTNQVFYGSGIAITQQGSTGDCGYAETQKASFTPSEFIAASGTPALYNERGEALPVGEADASKLNASTDLGTGYKWYSVPDLLNTFGGVPRLILAAIPIIVVASFLGLSAMGLVQYGQGRSGIGNAIGDAIGSLIFAVILLKVLPVVLDSVISADQAVDGPYSVTSTFGGILGLVFAAIPVILIAGLLAISGVLMFRKYGQMKGEGGGMMG